MEIKTVPISKLKAAKYNPRKDLQPDDPEYQKLERSMEEFGYIEPIIWNERTGNVVGGHQRLKILKAQGEKSVSVSVVNLDDDMEKALNVALNKIAGSWDNERLNDLMSGLDSDMQLLTGFDEWEIKALLVTDFEFDDVSLDDYEEPNKREIRCPQCGHVDSADRFQKS